MWWKFRNALQQVHLWIGLTLSIPFILIGLSGSAIVVMHAIPDFAMPFSTSSGEHHPLTRIIEAANEAAPEGKAAALVRMPQGAVGARICSAHRAHRQPEPARRYDLRRSRVAGDSRQRRAPPQRRVHALPHLDAPGAHVPVLLRRTDGGLDGRRDVPVRAFRPDPLVAEERPVASALLSQDAAPRASGSIATCTA